MRHFFYRGRFLFIPIAAAAFLSIISFIVMNLWNYLLPGILHVGVITFWQAMGIFILCKILFGFGKGGSRMRNSSWMRGNMQERFKNMTPEDKEKFKEQMKSRMCGNRSWGKHGRYAFDEGWDNATAGTEKTAE